MALVDQVKSRIERVHLDYLCDNFLLLENNHPSQFPKAFPDLAGLEKDCSKTKCVFELKSRNYPRHQSGRIRPLSDFCWWTLDHEQIDKYEQIRLNQKIGLYWIFLISQTEVPLTQLNVINEKQIKWRDIYLVSWDYYISIPPSGSGDVNIGLKRIKSENAFWGQGIKKGNLYISKEIKKYFCI